MGSQKSLAVTLSKLKGFSQPDTTLEQYATDSDIAALVLHSADMLGDIEGKHIVDLGAGTGILGLGALYYGAKRATLLDIDQTALDIAKENAAQLEVTNAEFVCSAVQPTAGDVVVMNPPFGTKTQHADRAFLYAAFESAPVVYSMHLASTKDFIQTLANEHSYELTHTWRVGFPLKNTMRQHKKKRTYIDVLLVRLAKHNS